MMVQNIVISQVIWIFCFELWNKINLFLFFLVRLSCYQSLKICRARISLRWDSFGDNLVDFSFLALIYLIKSLIQSLHDLPISLILFLIEPKLIIVFVLLYILLHINFTLFGLYFGLLNRIHLTIIFVKLDVLNVLNVFVVGRSIIFKFYLRFRVDWPAIANINVITHRLWDRPGSLHFNLLLIGLGLLISLGVNFRFLKFICLNFYLMNLLLFFWSNSFNFFILLFNFLLFLLKLNFWWLVRMILLHFTCTSAFF